MPRLGADYTGAIGTGSLKAAGVTFVGRYVADRGGNDWKTIKRGEAEGLKAAGIDVFLFHETSEDYMLGGYPRGVEAARNSDAEAKRLGLDGVGVYFCADWDVTRGGAATSPGARADVAAVVNCLRGAASVLGKGRTGLYGSYWIVDEAVRAGVCGLFCCTAAWSGGLWHPRAQLRQYAGSFGGRANRIAGQEIDWETAHADYFGQWGGKGSNGTGDDVVLPTLKLGSKGQPVMRMQQWFGGPVYPGLVVDGVFGPKTDEYVRKFQGRNGLTVDGVVGPATWRKFLLG